MKNIQVADLVEGVKFTEEVFLDKSNMLVPANVALKKKEIERLTKWGIDEVFTEGEMLLPAQKVDRSESGISRDSRLFSEYVDLVDHFSIFIRDAVKGVKPDLKIVSSVADTIISNFSSPDSYRDVHEIISYISKSDNIGEKRASGGVNCAILSVLLGLEYNMTGVRLQHLVIASLLHDIGMLKIPLKIIEKQGKLEPDELKVVKTHPVFSYQLITKNYSFPEAVGQAVLFHHERWDGKGYPKKLAGENIPLLARIIAVTDSFEAMNRYKSYRTSMIGYSAMKQILNENSKKYDPQVVKQFIKVLGIYPPGSIVIMNDKSIGKVIRIKKKAPLRPVLQLMIDSDGNNCSAESRTIDLMENKTLFIVKVIDNNELEGKM